MLLKGTLHFWLWRWLHLNGTWTMCKDALAEFMTLAHLIFVGSATFFSRPQHLRGQFDILTLPIWTFDRATKKLRAYMMYWSIRPPHPHFLQQSATTFTSPDRWSKWQWRCSSGAPDIHVNVFNTSNLKITPSSTRRRVFFFRRFRTPCLCVGAIWFAKTFCVIRCPCTYRVGSRGLTLHMKQVFHTVVSTWVHLTGFYYEKHTFSSSLTCLFTLPLCRPTVKNENLGIS